MVSKAGFQTLARNLQGTFGDFFEPRTFQNPPVFNVVTETTTAGSTDTVRAVRLEYDSKQVDGEIITIKDFKLMALVEDFQNVDPKRQGVTVTVDGNTCQVIDAKKDPADAAWTLQVRAL